MLSECHLISAKERYLVSGCPHVGSKTGVSLADCKGSRSQYNGNAFNYRPDTRECYIKTCKDENNARSTLVSFSQPFDVYYCDYN